MHVSVVELWINDRKQAHLGDADYTTGVVNLRFWTTRRYFISVPRHQANGWGIFVGGLEGLKNKTVEVDLEACVWIERVSGRVGMKI